MLRHSGPNHLGLWATLGPAKGGRGRRAAAGGQAADRAASWHEGNRGRAHHRSGKTLPATEMICNHLFDPCRGSDTAFALRLHRLRGSDTTSPSGPQALALLAAAATDSAANRAAMLAMPGLLPTAMRLLRCDAFPMHCHSLLAAFPCVCTACFVQRVWFFPFPGVGLASGWSGPFQ